MKLTNKYGYTESEVQAIVAMLERQAKGDQIPELIGPYDVATEDSHSRDIRIRYDIYTHDPDEGNFFFM